MYMNQTKKRLSIINLAISITDIETIQLQILKLGLLKTDTKIQEIIAVLQAENYAKAQRLIKVYIDTPIEEILQRASQQKNLDLDLEKLITPNKKETIISEEDQKIIDEFQLFTTNDDNRPTQTKKKVIDINDYLPDISDTPNIKRDTQAADFDALLNLEATDVMPDNIELDISQDPNESFFNISVKEEKSTSSTENISRDTFFDTNESEETTIEEPPSKDPFETLLTVQPNKIESLITKRKASLIKDALRTQAASEKDLQGKGLKETALKEIALKETALRKKSSIKTPLPKKGTTQKPVDITAHSPLEKELLQEPKVNTVPESYPAISYIRQKFVSMRKQYEPIQKNHDRFPTVETFLTTISQNGYKEKEIEETLDYVDKLIKEQKFAEAGQLQLVCASTESNFAQLMLARELYRGILLRKNVSEAFYILTHMADDNYPEALCDLGQFHENGIGTGRNKKVAEELYKKAMDMGIKRAEKHYARLKKQNKGFFKK